MYSLYYFGNVAYWQALCQASQLDFSLIHKIPKKSYINRTIILTSNGLQALSIPLKGGRDSKIIYKDVEICYAENWIHKHSMALQSAYSKSPYYEFYSDRVFAVLQKNYTLLSELNIALFNTISNAIKIEISLEKIDSIEKCIQFTPNKFVQIRPYPQVFRDRFDFYPDLSILDLLFNLGPRTIDYLNE